MEKNYNPAKEQEIYQEWEQNNLFSAQIDKNKEPFVIMMPPPNATGILHTGHASFCTYQDILIRYNRMQGVPSLWLPGTDHAAIATQSVVETKMFQEEWISRHDISREDFYGRIKRFAENSKSKIRSQIKAMGCSCDWDRERYTLDKGISFAVEEVFIQMMEDGLIYKGDRIVNWDPKLKTTVSDDEIEYKEREAILYYIQYGPFVIATSRPETKLADTGVAVNPNDERYQKYHNQEMEIDLAGHKINIKVVSDDEANMEFGSGAIGVTPAHSFVDFDIAQRHNLKVIPLISEDGKILASGGKYEGLSIIEARNKFVEALRANGQIIKEEKYIQNVSISDRGKVPVEPLIKKQWFIDVNKKFKLKHSEIKGIRTWQFVSLKELMLHVVQTGQTKIIPSRFEKVFFHWVDNLRDWCISRQIIWGHRIPVWYEKDNTDNFIASRECPGDPNNWEQDSDTLDTWFSSGLWAFATLGWPHKTEDFEYFYPTTILDTAYDILPFWVNRMILMGTYATGQIPFKYVYLNGLIRDGQGQKISKSLGNGIDPVKLAEKYGCDALRYALVIGCKAGNDLSLGEEKIKAYRNFVNKIWNSVRFALTILPEETIQQNWDAIPQISNLKAKDKWILNKLQTVIIQVNSDLQSGKFKFSDAAIAIYEFVWDDFCDWYIESYKVDTQDEIALKYIIKNILLLLHPFMPFVTEDIWHNQLQQTSYLITSSFPKANKEFQFKTNQDFEIIKNLISEIRSVRNQYKANPADKISLNLKINDSKIKNIIIDNIKIIKFLARIKNYSLVNTQPENCASIVLKGIEAYLPLDELINIEQEQKRIEKEIKEITNFIKISENKLQNKNFIQKAATQIIQREKNLLATNQEKLEKLQKNLKKLNS